MHMLLVHYYNILVGGQVIAVAQDHCVMTLVPYFVVENLATPGLNKMSVAIWN
jgi:hypothetical protein